MNPDGLVSESTVLSHCGLGHSLSLSAVGLRVGRQLAQFHLPPTVGHRAPPRDTMAPGGGG